MKELGVKEEGGGMREEGGRMKEEGGKNAERSTRNAQLSTLNPQRPEEASRACACAREGEAAADVTAEDVVRGYVDAVNGTLNIIRFGCMMLVKDAVLACENGKNANQYKDGNGGLRAWLAANVPDVNYKTAMRMKGTAETVASGLGVGAGVLLRALNPDPKALPDEPDCERLVEVRERLAEIVHGRSERSLVLWLKGGAPAPQEGREEETGKADEMALDAAKRFARAASDALKCLDARQRNAMTKALARQLREALGLKGLAWLAKVLEEAEG